jgi:hypothetical protein
MQDRSAIRRRGLTAACFIALAAIASLYAIFIAVSEGVWSAAVPIVIAILFTVNCVVFLTGRAFPNRD